jgi:hypothetical protein
MDGTDLNLQGLLCILLRGDQVMTIPQLLVLSAAAFAASTMAGYAGPCSNEIDRMQARIDARVEAVARTRPSAPETPGARLHHQPTPGSIAAAESKRGDVSSHMVEAVEAAMARARKADLAGDKKGCDQALADVRRAIGP